MKKFIKRLVVIIIIIACIYGLYYYKDELIEGVKYIAYQFDLLELEEEEIYSEAEIQEIINQTSNVQNGEYIGKIDNYYYTQLDGKSRIIYRVFKDNLELMKTGKYNLKLPSILEEELDKEDGQKTLNQSFQDAWDAFKLDNPEVYYIDVNDMCLMTQTITRGRKVEYELYIQNQEGKSSLPEQFNNKEEVDIAVNEINLVKEEIKKNILDNNFAKILYVHNWIIDNTKYDTSLNKPNNNNIYGGLVKKEIICEGYAKTFKYILDELDIPCVLVCGTGIDENGKTEKHAWNYVYLDGNWYAVDVTWDDPIIIGKGTLNNTLRYKYFLKGSEEFNKNHIEEGKFTKEGIEFDYPELNKINYNKKKLI